MTNDYIRRQDVLNLPKTKVRNFKGEVIEESIDIDDVKELEPADVAPVVHGEWLNAIFDSKRYRCSICNYHISNLVRENYCPNCGAKMYKGGEQDG